MSNQQEEGKLSKDEQEELKALQDVRKGAGNGGATMTDSQRVRLSELQAKAEPPAPAKAESKAATAGGKK